MGEPLSENVNSTNSNDGVLLNCFSVFNVHGLKPTTVPSKVPYVADLLSEKNQLFMALTETWLHNHKDGEVQIEGYKLFRGDRKRVRKSARGRFSGGVGCYVRMDIACTMETMINFSNGVVELLCLYSKVYNLYIAVIYRQPDDRIGNHRSTEKEFIPAISKLKESLSSLPDPSPNIFFCGDFNLPHVTWPDGILAQGCTTAEKSMLETISQLQDEHFLNQYVTSATHIDGGVLDLVFSNNNSIIHSYETLKPLRSTSDHFVVEVSTPLLCNTPEEEKEKPPLLSAFDNLNFFSNDIQWEAMSNEITHRFESEDLSSLPPKEHLEKLMKILIDVAYKFVPLKNSTRRGSHTKIPRERRILMRKRRKLMIQFEQSTEDRRKEKIREKLIQIELLIQKSHFDNRSRKEQRAVKAIKTNSKYFFAYAKQFSSTRSKVGPLLDELKEYTSSSPKMANILSTQYSSVFSKPIETPYHTEEDTNIESLTDIDFSEKDIVDAIDELKNNSASGPDGIAAIFLKKCKNSLSKPLFQLWRKCLDLGISPCKLKEAHIIPIYKGGHQGLASNYRPVALTSHLIKIFEKVVRNFIVKFLEENKLFNISQHGFRNGRSCLSQLLSHYDKILEILASGSNVDAVYLDFAKAFDKVDHGILLKKLSLLGIRGKLLEWIKSFLSCRKQMVLVNGVLSDPAPVTSGVPQGSVIGPLLFLVLIGDIDKNIVSSFLSSFADDTRLLRKVSGVRDASSLQTDLEAVYQWAEDNNCAFNNKKFEALRYGIDEILKLTTSYTAPDGTLISVKDHIRDLGVTMSADATFKEHINKIYQSANNMCSWILRTFQSRSPELMLTLWKSLVLPILDYCSQLWSPFKIGDIQRIENVQKAFTRKIQSSNRKDYWERLKTLGLYSLQRRRERYCVIYVWKILENLVPNLSGSTRITAKTTLRFGRLCNIPSSLKSTASSRLQSLRDSSFCVNGPNLFNALPSHIRNMTNVGLPKFKAELDRYLKTIADEPLSQGYTACRRAASNSLIHMIPSCG